MAVLPSQARYSIELQIGASQINGLRLNLSGPPDWPVRIQRSADPTAWQEWQTVTTRGYAPVGLTDPEAASQPQRFYRAVAP